MRLRSTTLLGLALPAAWLASACHEPLSVQDVVGTYVLQRVAGDPLPTLLFANEHITLRVLADTLRLTGDGSGVLARVAEAEHPNTSVPPDTVHGESAFRFHLARGRIEVAFECPINANCAPPPHIVARRTPDGLLVEAALGARVPQVYARVAASR
jgi:hypothetical protein